MSMFRLARTSSRHPDFSTTLRTELRLWNVPLSNAITNITSIRSPSTICVDEVAQLIAVGMYNRLCLSCANIDDN